MSSHHIVREKQEPALLVLGLDGFDDELLGQLLEWSPTVITTPLTAEKLNSYGIKIDWIIADGIDEIEQSDVKLMSANNHNLAEAALKHLTAYEYPSVNIVTDELNLSDYEPYAAQINIVVFNNGKKIFPVSPGFSKWKPAGDIVEILGDVKNLEIIGLEKFSKNRYKTVKDGLFSLRFDAPFLFIAEEL
ncbi:thiamine pyrophosphokinase [Mucilaginibacter flavidus]|uniref:thiamine pyrophosphokinase n=1 Tax=Mucilaginibacter flavidus TaxID=2949309 RepID=UPI002093FD3B|nr:thiamine pyrophosphokinase [Mucilaginibacter flavidus]MCO5950718.1 thiamine pyrophosphokinase [Mucilaginibacter flavidus]